MAKVHRDKWKDQGIGDTIERITKATGIKKIAEIIADGECKPCEERKKRLNEPNILINKIFYPKKQNDV